MRIKEIISQHRRDFYALYECEHCGQVTDKQCGYDDSYFHENVIPKMKCGECGKMSPITYRPLSTKYPNGMAI